MVTKKKLYQLINVFKPYMEKDKFKLKDGAPAEAVEAFQMFSKIMERETKYPPVEESPKNWKSPYD